MKLKRKNKRLAIGAILLTGSACSSPPVRPNPPAPTSAQTGPVASQIAESSIEFTYDLGHVQRKLLLRSVGNQAMGRNFYQKQVLQEGKLEGLQYDAYFLKVEDYCSRHVGQATLSPESCRSVFQIILKRGDQTCRVEGCRSHTAEDSALSHLIREGEFLLSHSSSPVASRTSVNAPKRP